MSVTIGLVPRLGWTKSAQNVHFSVFKSGGLFPNAPQARLPESPGLITAQRKLGPGVCRNEKNQVNPSSQSKILGTTIWVTPRLETAGNRPSNGGRGSWVGFSVGPVVRGLVAHQSIPHGDEKWCNISLYSRAVGIVMSCYVFGSLPQVERFLIQQLFIYINIAMRDALVGYNTYPRASYDTRHI